MRVFYYFLLLCFIIYSTSAQQRKSFITDIDFGGLVICNQVPDDSIFDQILASAHQKNTWIKFWDCLDFELPKVRNALIVLNKISPTDLKGILSKEDIQQSFRTNVWLIYIDRKNTSQYFNQNILKIGINAQIFFVESLGGNDLVTQVIGKGIHEIEYKVVFVFLIFFFVVILIFPSRIWAFLILLSSKKVWNKYGEKPTSTELISSQIMLKLSPLLAMLMNLGNLKEFFMMS